MAENCSPQSGHTPSSLGRHVAFRHRLRKTLYYGKYSDASLPSLPVTDVAVQTLNGAVPSAKRVLDKKQAMAVTRRARVAPCTLMMGLLYTERLGHKNPAYLKSVSSSDLFLISIMMASKYLYDEGEDEEVFNDDWARAGGKCVRDVNQLEVEFLDSIHWNLFVDTEEFLCFVNKVESSVAVSHGLARGWFTYTDLCTLLDNWTFHRTLHSLRDETLKVLCLCTAAYMAAISLTVGCAVLLPSVMQCAAVLHPHPHLPPASSPPLVPINNSRCMRTQSSHHMRHHPNSGLHTNKSPQPAASVHSGSSRNLTNNATTEQYGLDFVASSCLRQTLGKNLSPVNQFSLNTVFCTALHSKQQQSNSLTGEAPGLSANTSMQLLEQVPSVCTRHFLPSLYRDITATA